MSRPALVDHAEGCGDAPNVLGADPRGAALPPLVVAVSGDFGEHGQPGVSPELLEDELEVVDGMAQRPILLPAGRSKLHVCDIPVKGSAARERERRSYCGPGPVVIIDDRARAYGSTSGRRNAAPTMLAERVSAPGMRWP